MDKLAQALTAEPVRCDRTDQAYFGKVQVEWRPFSNGLLLAGSFRVDMRRNPTLSEYNLDRQQLMVSAWWAFPSGDIVVGELGGTRSDALEELF